MNTSSGSNKKGGQEDNRVRKRTNKGKVDVTEFKRTLNFSNDPTINHIACNQTQEYFAVATNIGFEIIQNDSSSDRLKKKC